ncbi:hypothetical protein [Ructibacterium gallinarum]|uniref:Uncharacterized protein n=1 Tax=Ructibacterium gallinarum TaxID=2779355 RepID=A0A9D5M5G4_9FIRM|nr:hypothetical protein [Ructibacterium gallinarum]MBE5040955.1 hypothetical protein [Ructibacterium gallinarum]
MDGDRAMVSKEVSELFKSVLFSYKETPAIHGLQGFLMVRVFLQDLLANAVKSRVSDSQYTVLTLKLNIFLLSKCFDYKKSRHFLFYHTGFIAPY